MKIQFTDLFNNESKGKFNISYNEVLEAIKEPNKRELLNLPQIEHSLIGFSSSEDFKAIFYLKHEVKMEGKPYLLIATHELKEGNTYVDFALKIYPDFIDRIEELNPIEILRELANEFGLMIKIGKQSSKFIYKELLPLKVGSNQTRIVSIENPQNHSFIQSIFVKIDKSKSKIICALAFCIDSSRYATWLHARERKLIEKYEVEEIIRRNGHIKDYGKRFNLIELGISLRIIQRVMGKDWYEKVLRQFAPGTKIKTREYWRLVRSQDVHPLSEALWSGLPENYIRVISLAYFLEKIWKVDDSNNISEKIKELRQYGFEKTYFELKCACYYERKECQVEFIKRRKGEQTPEFKIISNGEFAIAECKKKSKKSLDVRDNLQKASDQIEAYGGPGIIFIELSSDHPIDIKSLQDEVDFHLRNKEKVSSVVFVQERILQDGDFIRIRTIAQEFKNPSAEMSLPITIASVTSNLKIPEWIPFQELLI
jgi:hypothetical protein